MINQGNKSKDCLEPIAQNNATKDFEHVISKLSKHKEDKNILQIINQGLADNTYLQLNGNESNYNQTTGLEPTKHFRKNVINSN